MRIPCKRVEIGYTHAITHALCTALYRVYASRASLWLLCGSIEFMAIECAPRERTSADRFAKLRQTERRRPTSCQLPVASCNNADTCHTHQHTHTGAHTVSLCDCFGLAEDRRQVAACIVFVSVVACRMPQAARRTPHLPNPPLSPPASDKLIGHFGPKGKRLQQSQQN